MSPKNIKTSRQKSSTSPTSKNKNDEAALSFEDALQNLQAVVARMENQQQSLEASIADYEQGMQLSALCQKHLDEAQLKVEQLVKTKSGHHFEEFENTDDS